MSGTWRRWTVKFGGGGLAKFLHSQVAEFNAIALPFQADAGCHAPRLRGHGEWARLPVLSTSIDDDTANPSCLVLVLWGITFPIRLCIMTERTEYLLLKPESPPPNITAFPPFRAVVIVEADVTPEWQSLVSRWLVKSGCLYMMAWGVNCSTWHDLVDMANIEQFNFSPIPDDKFVFTTCHTDEPQEGVFWYSKNCALHSSVELERTVLLHISASNRERELLKAYADA